MLPDLRVQSNWSPLALVHVLQYGAVADSNPQDAEATTGAGAGPPNTGDGGAGPGAGAGAGAFFGAGAGAEPADPSVNVS